MGTTTAKTFTETSGSGSASTWTLQFRGTDFLIKNDSISLPTPQALVKYVGSNKGYGYVRMSLLIRVTAGSQSEQLEASFRKDSGDSSSLTPIASGTTYTINGNVFFPIYVPTSDIFNENNPTTRTATVTIEKNSDEQDPHNIYLVSCDSSWGHYGYAFKTYADPAILFGTICTATLDAPPTFKVVNGDDEETTSVAFDTPYVYAGLTTASINISDIEAKYGGYVSSVAFTIGNQTVTGSTSGGTLSIPLNAGGIFTPTVTVTDSRGQTTTKTLDAITVNTYTVPSVTFDIERTTSAGVDDDEGESAVAVASFNWTDVVATLSTPTVSAVDSDGNPVAITAAWYKDRALTTAISDWSTITANDMPVYGLIDNASHNAFDTQYSYQVSITPNDSEGSGIAITQTLGSAFYTIDFLAGGHGIAFGQPSSRDGFECSMTAIFHDTVDVEDALTAQSVTADENLQGQNALLELDTDTASGTDYDIYTALVALGWATDVIV